MITPELVTDRLLLRQFSMKDIQEVFNCWLSDPEVSRYMMWEASSDINDTQEFLKYEMTMLNDDNWFRWAITDKRDGTILGTCLIFYNDEAECWDISYNLGRKYWGHGYITEAMKIALNFIINIRGVNKFIAEHAIENPGSGNVITKLGFKYEKDTEYECGNGYRTTGRRYRLVVDRPDYSCIIGSRIRGMIDRPAGSVHPQHADITYPVNYGYVEGLFAADGEEQDVYFLGTDKPLEQFEGNVIAVYHRVNDVEDKWIAVPDGISLTDEEILNEINFMEKYFVGKLYR